MNSSDSSMPDQPAAGPSSTTPSDPPQPPSSSSLDPPGQPSSGRTLSALWGAPSSSAAALQRSASNTSNPPPARKRKKNDAAPTQARLTFSVDGVGVTAPPPPPPAPPPAPANGDRKRKPRAKRKPDGDTTTNASPKKRGRQPAATSSAVTPDPAPAFGGLPMSPDSPEIIVLSSDMPEIVVTGSSDADIIVTGGTARKRSSDGRRRVTADPSLPTHSFFSRRADPDPTAPLPATASVATSRSTTATAQPSDAASGTTTPAAPKQVHSFFNLAARDEPGKLKNGWGCCKEGEEPAAPWPGGEWPAHVDAPTAEPAEGRPRMFALRAPQSHADTNGVHDHNDHMWISRDPGPSRSRPSETVVTAPPFIMAHPAITAVSGTTLDGRESWCEAHRPRTAAAVLGNEVEATYLRDWLSALSVGGHEGRRVIRRMPRGRAVDPDKSWIVDDIGMFGEPFTNDVYANDDEEVPEPVEEPILPLGARPDAYPPIGKWIGNSILLSGPSGCGKTAAVYAAANELGWDVFEVYPGIGRRTGTNLLALVGDVGKNHMVTEKKEKPKSTAEAATASFFGKVQPKPKVLPMPSSQGSANDPISLDDESDPQSAIEVQQPTPELVPEPKTEVKTKQSLILIDEADILFEEENTFWPAVISLIAESRRPVVITCNDPGRIRDNVPLQTTLHFFPAPGYLAQPYLDSIAKHHGVHTDVATLYAQCSHEPLDLVDQPLPPNGNEPAANFDLRAAITQMQLDRSKPAERREPASEVEPRGDFADVVRRLESVSFADAFVAPRAWARMEVADVDHLEHGPDDQEGLAQLLKLDVQELHPTLAAYDYSADMAATLVALGGGPFTDDHKLQLTQTAYVRSLLPVLDPLVNLSMRLLPDPTLFLETVPVVSSLVRADDLAEVAFYADIAAGKRPLNRRGRAMRITQYMETRTYERYLGIIPPDGLETARTMSLEWRA